MEWMEMCTFCDAGCEVFGLRLELSTVERSLILCKINIYMHSQKIRFFIWIAVLYFCILFHRYRMRELRSDQRKKKTRTMEMQRWNEENTSKELILPWTFLDHWIWCDSIWLRCISAYCHSHTRIHSTQMCHYKCRATKWYHRHKNHSTRINCSGNFNSFVAWFFFSTCFNVCVCVCVVQWKFKGYDIKIEYSF